MNHIWRQMPAALLRMVIGWHFLYEGFTKLLLPGWTSAGYLENSPGPLSALFQWLAAQKALTPVVDALNVWGLIAVGLALMLGIAVRPASAAGMALLAMYYMAYPPLFSPAAVPGSEGAYLIVNKNLVELFALGVVLAYPASGFSLSSWWKARSAHAPEAVTGDVQRRELLAQMAGLPVFGAFLLAVLRKHGWRSFEEANLNALPRSRSRDSFAAGASFRPIQVSTRSDLNGSLPYGHIGNMRLSRMILGGNLMGGWAHARDLIYVSKLVKAYHTREKVFQTLALAESCGVNTLLTNPALCGIINDYWRNGGRIQFISDCGGKPEDLITAVKKSVDRGASACYVQGGLADQLVERGRFDLIAEAIDLIRRNGLPAGIGGHKLETIQRSVQQGLKPDFWMKTLHEVTYWSARPGERECDNIWCVDPDATVEYMRSLDQPWIAFKVLAAGALQPKPAFRYAFENGADFICVGMYDFQIVDDVNIAVDVLRGPLTRQRIWRA
jgi:uncharacterized membrane protein YphA (DoxX/SURF4 family)